MGQRTYTFTAAQLGAVLPLAIPSTGVLTDLLALPIFQAAFGRVARTGRNSGAPSIVNWSLRARVTSAGAAVLTTKFTPWADGAAIGLPALSSGLTPLSAADYEISFSPNGFDATGLVFGSGAITAGNRGPTLTTVTLQTVAPFPDAKLALAATVAALSVTDMTLTVWQEE